MVNISEFAKCAASAHSGIFLIENKQPQTRTKALRQTSVLLDGNFQKDNLRVIHKNCTDPAKGDRCATIINIYRDVCVLVVLGPVVATSA